MLTDQLKPCPFCGSSNIDFERKGTHRQSCIVACGSCGARHESGDEDDRSGESWNCRAIEAEVKAEKCEPVVTDAMAYAFNSAIGDASLGADEVEQIKSGLKAALYDYVTTPQPCPMCAELAQDLQTTADVLAEYVESHRNIELAHANQYEILCRRTDEVIKSEQAWQQLDDDRVEYINDVGDILGQNDTDESLLNAAKRVMATIEFQKKAWEADFIRMTRIEAAIERMRVAGGKDEFWNAFELAKDLL